MSNKMERFTQRARKVLSLAQEEAERMQHAHIGTEHLLLGLMREEGGVASRVLRDLGVRPDEVERIVERLTGANKRPGVQRMDLSPATKRVLELAVEEARRMGHHYIGTEHLLLGLVRYPEGVASDVLRELKISPEEIRSQTRRVLQDNPFRSRRSSEKRSERSSRSAAKTPLVDQLATDLTALAEQGKLDPVIGREMEIERVIQILSRRQKNNPALIGEPGVGKTAIVEGLAQRIVDRDAPAPLLGKRVLQLDVGSLVAGTMYRGQFEERLKRVIEELKQSDSILFIDEVHMLVGAGAAGSSIDAANILKPALARGELQCIGATTLDEYRKYIEADPALERRFQPVIVEEPSPEKTLEILRGIRYAYEQHHNLRISDEALEAAVRLSARYVSDRYLPDKAIDLMDEAASRVRMYKSPTSKRMREIFEALQDLRIRRNRLIAEGEHEAATALGEEEKRLEEEMQRLRDVEARNSDMRVGAEDIAEIVAMWTGIPISQLAEEESRRLLDMEEALARRVVGQQEAIAAIAQAVRRARAGLKDPHRPIGSFIFLGPTGVGKTELAKALAEFLFGSEEALIQLDMSEFMERHTVSRLVGAPPGYVGYEEAGQLTEAIRRRPYAIVVFDEIEKAHPDAFNMLLQIMEEGTLTDARGRKVDFSNTLLILTSNVGADEIRRQGALGFASHFGETNDHEAIYEAMSRNLRTRLRKLFRPEFLNRLDGIIIFRPLDREALRRIVELEVEKVRRRLREGGFDLHLTAAALDWLAEHGYSEEYGARPLRRLIQQEIEAPLSDAILAGDYHPGETIVMDADEGGLFPLPSAEQEAAAPVGA